MTTPSLSTVLNDALPCGLGCDARGCGFCTHTPAEEQIGALHLHGCGDAALHPVLDALGAAGGLVEAEGLGQRGGAAERLDQLGVGVEGFGVVHEHGLNIAFKQKSNATFNNTLFSPGTILGNMNDPAMHPTMARLYEAAKAIKQVRGQSAVARLLNASPQTLKNWEARGVSKQGAITAQQAIGCDATWLLEGSGDMQAGVVIEAPTYARVAEPAAPYNNEKDDVEIRQFDAGGGMGSGRLLLDDQPGVIKSWHVDHDWLRLNVRSYSAIENLCIVTGFGPSMRPMFNPGDPLLVDRGVKVVDTDAVFFFRVGDHGFIKALQRIPTANGLILRAKSKNPDYDPFDIDQNTMDFEVLGKVLTVWKSEQF